MKRFAWLALALLAGCPHPALPFGPEGEIADPQRLLALLAKRDGQFVSVQGEAKLKVESPRGKGSVSQYVAVLRPAALHIESFNFFNEPVSVLVSDGQRFSLYDAEHNVFYRGEATEQAMARFLPISLPPPELVALMLGEVPRIPAKRATLRLDAPRARYVLELSNGPVTQELEVATDDLRVLKSTVLGADAYDLALDDYREEQGGRFPHRIELDAPAQGMALAYRYGDIHLNGAPDLTLFHQEPPAGATIVELDARGNPIQQHQP